MKIFIHNLFPIFSIMLAISLNLVFSGCSVAPLVVEGVKWVPGGTDAVYGVNGRKKPMDKNGLSNSESANEKKKTQHKKKKSIHQNKTKSVRQMQSEQQKITDKPKTTISK